MTHRTMSEHSLFNDTEGCNVEWTSFRHGLKKMHYVNISLDSVEYAKNGYAVKNANI